MRMKNPENAKKDNRYVMDEYINVNRGWSAVTVFDVSESFLGSLTYVNFTIYGPRCSSPSNLMRLSILSLNVDSGKVVHELNNL